MLDDNRTEYDDPNVGAVDGDDRILWVPFAADTVFRRRGGKAVDLHHRYQAATANSSNLAGFAEVEDVGVSDGHPETVLDGDELPVNMGLQKTHAFPTTGRAATEADVGKDFDLHVDGSVQHVNLSGTTNKVLRVSKVLDSSGNWVACAIPTGKRYGNL